MYYTSPANNTQNRRGNDDTRRPNAFAGLAPELLENIFSHLSQRDLTHVVRVCWPFALSGRFLLYRHVDWRSDDPHIEHTLALLKGDATIGVNVLSAVITTRPPRRLRSRTSDGSYREENPWIDPTFALHWTRLRVLEMRGFPFSDTRLDARNFSVTLRDSCLQLEKFLYKAGYGTPPDNFELRGLQEVGWKSGKMMIEMPFQPTMLASRLTLTSISFTGTVFHSSHRKPDYDNFLRLYFPSLQTLALGSLQYSISENWTNTTITEFILKHPTIVHLSLGRRRPTYLVFFQFVESKLKSDSLPSLKSFEGFPENITLLARRGVKSFFHITELSIGFEDEQWDDRLRASINEMYEAVTGAEAPRRLIDVVYLRCEQFVTFSHKNLALNTISMENQRSMDQILHLCSTVARLYVRLPPMSADNLRAVFWMCDQVEVISLPRLSLVIHMKPSEVEYFRPVARACTRLRKVIARKPDYSEMKDFVFLLERGADGDLQSVTVEESWNEAML